MDAGGHLLDHLKSHLASAVDLRALCREAQVTGRMCSWESPLPHFLTGSISSEPGVYTQAHRRGPIN